MTWHGQVERASLRHAIEKAWAGRERRDRAPAREKKENILFEKGIFQNSPPLSKTFHQLPYYFQVWNSQKRNPYFFQTFHARCEPWDKDCVGKGCRKGHTTSNCQNIKNKNKYNKICRKCAYKLRCAARCPIGVFHKSLKLTCMRQEEKWFTAQSRTARFTKTWTCEKEVNGQARATHNDNTRNVVEGGKHKVHLPFLLNVTIRRTVPNFEKIYNTE